MGIRFSCPNGHKLHVKSFLAGKKGICPDCGAKVEIPYQSTRTSSKGEGSNPVSQAPPDTPLAMPVEPKGSGSDSAPPKASGSDAAAKGVPHRPAPAEQPVASPGPSEKALSGPASGKAGVGSNFGHLPHPTNPNDSAKAVPMSSPTASPASTPATVPAAKVPADQAGDPIVEAPQAVWYVRPKTGGQFGPAPGDVFSRWLDEGRVGSDSLVWREGWQEWKLASETFDKFSKASSPGGKQPPSAPDPGASGVPLVVSPKSVRSPESQRLAVKRSTANATIMFIILLVLATAALIPVLVYVILQK